MKTLRLFSVLVVFSLVAVACSPKDPAVLNKQEKEAEQKRRDRSGGQPRNSLKWTDSKFPITPPTPEISFSSHVLDRQSQAVAFLKLGLDLVAQGGELAKDPCLTPIIEKKENEWTADFDVECMRLQSGGQQTQHSGSFQMVLTLDAQGELQALKVLSNEIGKANGATAALVKSGFPGTANLQDQYDFRFRRVPSDSLTYELQRGTVVTAVSLSTPQTQTLELTTKTTGLIDFSGLRGTEPGVLFVQTDLKSVFTFKGEIQNGTPNPKPVLISLKNKESFNAMTLSVCHDRWGQAILDFEFTAPKATREISYTTNKVSMVDSRGQGRSWETPACLVDQASMYPGTSVDWGQILLYVK